MRIRTIACFQAVLVAAAWGSAGEEVDPRVLLEKYGLCNKKLQTIYYELETTRSERRGEGQRVYSLKYCSDGEQVQWIGHWTQFNEDGTVDQPSSSLVADIYRDQWGVHLRFHNPELKSKAAPRASLVRSRLQRYAQDYTNHPPFGGSLSGRFFGNNDQSVYDLLRLASKLHLDKRAKKIAGYGAYLIEADTAYGIVRAWISPDVHYNCLRWENIKKPHQFHRDGGFTSPWYTEYSVVYEAEKVERIDGQCLATQAKLDYRVTEGKKVTVNDIYHFRLSNIDLDPDYEALGAFEIQLPEGTMVWEEDKRGVRYRWTEDRLTPWSDGR